MKRLLILVTFLGLTASFCDVQGSGYLDWQKAKQIAEVAKLPYNLKKAYDQKPAVDFERRTPAEQLLQYLEYAFKINDAELFIAEIQKGALAGQSQRELNHWFFRSIKKLQ